MTLLQELDLNSDLKALNKVMADKHYSIGIVKHLVLDMIKVIEEIEGKKECTNQD